MRNADAKQSTHVYIYALETLMPSRVRTRIFTCWRQIFPKLLKITKSFVKLLEECFSVFLKIKYDNPIWQVIGDALVMEMITNGMLKDGATFLPRNGEYKNTTFAHIAH